ncbi:hypothetical protein A5747_07200 [Mycobacterium sp. IS-836]|nr:hypothetical protein A5747_07200 [Mycobacterium sp. IS-836]
MLSVESDPAKISGVSAPLRPLIIPSTVQTHGKPDRGCDDFHQWATDNQGVDAGETVVQIVAQGTTDKAVLLKSMRVSVIDTSPPLTGIGVVCMSQGVAQRRGISVDLDAKPPTVDYKSDSNAPFGFTLAKGETETFLVSARAAKATYRWKIFIDVVVNGKTKSLEIGGKDGFLTTAPPSPDSEWSWDYVNHLDPRGRSNGSVTSPQLKIGNLGIPECEDPRDDSCQVV